MRMGMRMKLGLRMGTGLRYNDQSSWIIQDFPNFKTEIPTSQEIFHLWAVGLSKLETKLSLGMAMESRLGSR